MKTLNVICINDKGTKKLIKNQTYKAISLFEDTHTTRIHNNITGPTIIKNGKKVFKRRIYIDGINSYDVDRFKLVDSDVSFYDIELFGDKYPTIRRRFLKNNIDYTWQYVMCSYSNSKYLKEKEIYLVLKDDIKNRRLKLKGIKYYQSKYKFEEIELKEQRNLKLKSLTGEDINDGTNKRKFLHYSEFEKIKILFETLAESMSNINNVEELNNINIVDVMLKMGKKNNIEESDILPLFNSSIKNIMKNLNLYSE